MAMTQPSPMSCQNCAHLLALVQWCGLLTVRNQALRTLPKCGCAYHKGVKS